MVTELPTLWGMLSFFIFRSESSGTDTWSLDVFPGRVNPLPWSGPKMAITILSGLPLEKLVTAITTSDIKSLSSIKGLGKKTAERIVLELGNKLGNVGSLETLLTASESAPINLVTVLSKEIDEASDVLVQAGLQKSQAVEIAKRNFVQGMTSEELVVACFRNLK